MQTLINPHSPLFFFPKTLTPKPSTNLKNPNRTRHLSWQQTLTFTTKALAPDESPLDDTLPEDFTLLTEDDLRFSEDECRKRNWIDRGWAPWEELYSPEAEFAKKSLNEGEEVALKNPEAVEAFWMMRPSYREKRLKELGLTEEEHFARKCEIRGEILEPLVTTWCGPLVVRMLPPRDWPPRGWEVDEKELEFIRGAHKLQAARVDLEEETAKVETDDMCLERYKVFLKQYKEWVAANKDRLEEEAYEQDQDYFPGRRKRGKDYKEDMLELPFYYPGQICTGKVTTLHLYQGAFVDIGGVHDGWVPIKGNDWYWIRQHIKLGMDVIVEILAKRDPYRFRFPIEMRFVSPNIDHLIFNRFEFPPIFHRNEDINLDELRRDCGRPPVPRRDLGIKDEEQPLLSNHPYVNKLWQLHVAEQLVLDHEESDPDMFKDKRYEELAEDTDFNEEDAVECSETPYKDIKLPKITMNTNIKELDLDAARTERELRNTLREEAKERGEKYIKTKLRRNIEMDEYDFMHWRRSVEEREALLRDISCRQTLGLPLLEPGRYIDGAILYKGIYDPTSPLYRYDYWGEPRHTEKRKQIRMTGLHNKGIIGMGKGRLWDMSYEDYVKDKMERDARSENTEVEEEEEEDESDLDEENDSDYDDYVLDISMIDDQISKASSPYSKASSRYSKAFSRNSKASSKPVVNGTESPSIEK